MIEAYLQERYGDNLEIDWNEYLIRYGLICYMTKHGFVTYKLQGDAAMIYDMYVSPEARGHTHAWHLHDRVYEAAKETGKRVMLAFSDYKGINHMAGIKAMKVSGFTPAYKTNEQFIFVKGI